MLPAVHDSGPKNAPAASASLDDESRRRPGRSAPPSPGRLRPAGSAPTPRDTAQGARPGGHEVRASASLPKQGLPETPSFIETTSGIDSDWQLILGPTTSNGALAPPRGQSFDGQAAADLNWRTFSGSVEEAARGDEALVGFKVSSAYTISRRKKPWGSTEFDLFASTKHVYHVKRGLGVTEASADAGTRLLDLVARHRIGAIICGIERGRSVVARQACPAKWCFG